MLGASSLCAVVAGMSILSADVRSLIGNLIAGDPGGDLSAAALRLQDYSHALVRAAADYRAANAPLVGFGVVAVVLAFLMFRT